MNFRFEEKLKLNNNKLHQFKEWLNKNNFKEIYETREVYSIYYDNNLFQTYVDSNEGVVPRSKLRIRTYNFTSFLENKFNIEIKNSLNYGRLKSSKKLENIRNSLKFGIYLKNYGFCYPKIIVKYQRTYFNFKNVRITLDNNIEFKKYNKFLHKGKFYNKCNLIVAEIKYSSKNQLSKLFDELPFEKTRFSKYCIGLETLNLI